MTGDEVFRLANDVLDISRNRLLVNLRYMDVALSMHKRAVYDGTISTDGSTIYISPEYVLRVYRESREEITRIYLHQILHCIFLQQFTGAGIDRKRWDLACDIAAETVICELNLACTRSDRQDRQLRYIRDMKRTVRYLTAEKIYAYLGEHISEVDMDHMSELFSTDDHSIWYTHETSVSSAPQSKEQISGPSMETRFSDEDQWKNIAKQIEMELEIFGKVRGESSGSLIQNIRAVTRERCDYSDFLRQFAASGEEMRVSDEEFDYIYYTYGLKHYRNMPLIEPLEYREDHRIRDFVIAIDTSGSVAGDEVQTFLRKTYGILNQQGSFF